MACPAIILMGLVQILVVNQNLYERNAYALKSYISLIAAVRSTKQTLVKTKGYFGVAWLFLKNSANCIRHMNIEGIRATLGLSHSFCSLVNASCGKTKLMVL